MAAKKTSKKPSKSDFIRQHADLSAADVIAKGKAAGIEFTSSLVYMVRGRQDGKKAAKGPSSPKKAVSKPAAKKAAAKKASAASKPVSPKTATATKADFVRQRGHLSPKEIVEDAKTHGVKLDANYIYTVRGYDKRGSAKKRVAKKTASAKPAVTSATASTSKPSATDGAHRSSGTTVEDLLRAVAAELGLGRAIEIIQGERARVRAVMGG